MLRADKAKDRRTGELVALKRLRMERERDGGWEGGGLRRATRSKPNARFSPVLFLHLRCKHRGVRHLLSAAAALNRATSAHATAGMPVTSVRELRVLQTCKHPNLVELKCVVTGA